MRSTSILIALGVIVVDHLTKWLAPQFGWHISYNSGFSFGFVAQSPVVLLVLLAGAFAAALWWWRTEAGAHPVATGCVLGGAVANLADRALFGAVRDWLPVPFLPLQNNLADWAIAVGILTFLYQVVRAAHTAERAA